MKLDGYRGEAAGDERPASVSRWPRWTASR